MSKMNKVAVNLNQDFTEQEMTTARNNIRAASSEQVNNHTEKIEASTTGTQVLKCINGVIQWVNE